MERFFSRKALTAFIFALTALFFTACSSGGGSGGSDGTTDVEGAVLRSLLLDPTAQITVFVDENFNGKLYDSEPTTTVDDDGGYIISVPNRLVAASTTSIKISTSTSNVNLSAPLGASVSTTGGTYTLFTPAGQTTISPYTTILYSETQDGVAVEQAVTELKTKMSDPDIDFFSTDTTAYDCYR